MSKLKMVPNPFCRIILYRDGSKVTGAEVHAPRKGLGKSVFKIQEKEDPSFLNVLRRLAEGGGAGRVSKEHKRRLTQIGLFVSEEFLPAPVWFSCFLSNVETELIPPKFRRLPSSLKPESWIVNPGFRYERKPSSIPKKFLKGYPLAWVRDSSTQMEFAYWVDREYLKIIPRLEPGKPAPANLSKKVSATLKSAQILVSKSRLSVNERKWRAVFKSNGKFLRQNKYAIFHNVIPPMQIASMRRYCRSLAEQGYLQLGDEIVGLRLAEYQEPLLSYWHSQLGQLFHGFVHESLKPSYNYLATYVPGATLRKHVDRDYSTYGAALLWDYAPEPEKVSPWPLCVEVKKNRRSRVPIHQGIGDILVYSACKLPHFRDIPLPWGHVSTSSFFFFVSSNTEGLIG